MRLLLSKFRIPVSDVVVIPDMTYPPSTQTKTWFDALTNEFVRRDDEPVDPESTGMYFSLIFLLTNVTQISLIILNFLIVPTIKESELMAQKPKTFNYMRLRELLLKYSTEANLIVM